MTHLECPIITLLIPVYRDQKALSLLLPKLDEALSVAPSDKVRWRVLLVNDGATDPPLESDFKPVFERIETVETLWLRRNLGHQRAIAIGLSELAERAESDAVVVLDGDGEDDPKDIPRLLERMEVGGYQEVVFAERRKRSEGVLFVAGYHAYRWLHHVLTGVPVRFGNFSIIPRCHLDRLVCADELWNHYAASVVKLKLPFSLLHTERAHRLARESRMNTLSLVVHGLSAMSVFSEQIGVRLLFATSTCGVLLLALITAVVVVRFMTDLAVPGWATYTTGILLLMLGQLFVACLLFAFITLSGRTTLRFLPMRDYTYFIFKRERVYPEHD